jgi:glucose/arabinose dehydrogenase
MSGSIRGWLGGGALALLSGSMALGAAGAAGAAGSGGAPGAESGGVGRAGGDGQVAAPGGAAPFRRDGSPFVAYRDQRPGRSHRIRPADLPPPNATPSADNPPSLVKRPPGLWPQAPAGFTVTEFAHGLTNPRYLAVAPNGDVFVAESRADKVTVFRGLTRDGRAAQQGTFYGGTFTERGLDKPFGMAFFSDPAAAGPGPQWLYVASTDAVVRFPYQVGDLRARGAPQKLAALPGGGLLRGGGHWTRDLAFSLDRTRMFVSVGSHSNVEDPDVTPAEHDRADILELGVTGKGQRIFASGIRNAVGIAVHPRTGALWASVNERDELGDDLVPDYITTVPEGAFFGWPWFYIGGNPDPRHRGKHPELRARVRVPDVLLQPHFASLQMTFYGGAGFPREYLGDVFAAEHGSWNRHERVGYEVIRVPLDAEGRARGDYQDFLTGFVTPDGQVWGRPVGVAVAGDGALLVADDGSNAIWRVSYGR